MLYTQCYIRSAIYAVQYTQCNIRSAIYAVQYTQCNIRSAMYSPDTQLDSQAAKGATELRLTASGGTIYMLRSADEVS
jgi:hypothetical protein